jgi:AraC-like DNA-binding protein
LLSIDDKTAISLNSGDFVIIPQATTFAMRSDRHAVVACGIPSNGDVHHGEFEKPDFVMLGGSFDVRKANSAMLTSLLPKPIVIAADRPEKARLAAIIDLVHQEALEAMPGRDIILARLLEVLLVEAVRGDITDGKTQGLLHGLKDASVSRVLQAIHADPARSWKVMDLAGIAGMSRSAFSEKFSVLLGFAPKEYLSHWRIALAKAALSKGGVPLEQIALEVGFQSSSAFSTAFKRRVGESPGVFARQMDQKLDALVN